MAFTIGKPTKDIPGRRSVHKYKGIALALEGLTTGEWLPVECETKTEATHLGSMIQQRYRTGAGRHNTRKCETRAHPELPIIYLRLVEREADALSKGGKA